jgi:monovalent cation:proton antiporter-2 (CPA2) family protein
MSEIGVLLLMFIAGLETDLAQLRKNWKSAFAVAIGGIVLPFFGGLGVGEWFGFAYHNALFLGVVLSATSVSISVQVLKEMNKLNSPEGTTILGAAVVDDILVVILLAVLMSFFGTGEEVSISLLISQKVIFFAAALLAGWLLVPRVMKWLAPLRVTEATITGALVICFGYAYFAERMGMAGIIGAFAAGIAIAQTSFKHVVEAKVEPIAYSLFVPVFFVSIGLSVTFAGAGSQILFMLLLAVVAVVAKMLGGGLGARLTGFSTTSSAVIGAGMISRGEVALIIAATGLESGLLLPEYFTAVILVVIVTTLVTPPLLKSIFREPGQSLAKRN